MADAAFRSLLDRVPDAALLHQGGVIVHANGACATLLAGGDVSRIVSQPLEHFMRDEIAQDGEGHVRTLGGEQVFVIVGAVPLSFQGEPSALLLFKAPSTGPQLDARLLLTDRMASIGALTAGVAHEANNPLGYALTNVDFALEQLSVLDAELEATAADERAQLLSRLGAARARLATMTEALREARHGADRVRQLVRELKAFSRADDDRRAPIDVRHVLQSAINMAQNELRSRAQLVKDLGPTPLVLASEARLGQVFLNLIVNAAQAIPEGNADVQRVRVRTSTDDRGRCLIEVSDTGQGISDADLSRIFDPFFTTKTGTGTGLGLAICQAIISSLNGEITVKSAVGKGTTFHVALPATEDEAPDACAPRSARDSGIATRARVLVVDDEPMMARAVGRLLGSEHDIVTTTDPKVAIELIRSGKRFDAVLCDLMMPGLSGMDVYEAVASVDAPQAERFIFMTGGAFTPRAEKFLERVGNVRLDKPLDRAALRAAVRACTK
jgi:signal transduction histidine kinase/CheY-like chemotaxis protein